MVLRYVRSKSMPHVVVYLGMPGYLIKQISVSLLISISLFNSGILCYLAIDNMYPWIVWYLNPSFHFMVVSQSRITFTGQESG